MATTESPPASSGRLPRVLGPWMAIAIVIGTVIGSGVFKKPAEVAREIDAFGLAIVAWVLVGVVALFGSLALAEVAVLYPKAGGNYVFLREAYGRGAGFMWGWVDFWIIRGASIPALATIFTESLHDILKQAQGLGTEHEVLSYWGRNAVTVAVIGVLAYVNARGTRLGGGLQLIITSVKVLSLIAIAVLPFMILAFVHEPRTLPSASRLLPVWPSSWGEIDWAKFGVAMLGVLWAYHGWMNLVPVAEEVRNPNRNIPFALIVGTLTIMALYLSVNLAYYLVIPGVEMKSIIGRSVAGEFGFRMLGSVGLLLISAAVMLSVFGSLNGNILVGPRTLYAMGQDGLAPRVLSRIHPRYRTPVLAILILAGWSSFLLICVGVLVQYRREYTEAFSVLTNYAVFGAVTFETLAVASIFVFRRRFPVDKVQLPYRCPLYPWVPALHVGVMAAVLANMFSEKPLESLMGLGFICLGAAVYRLIYYRPGIAGASSVDPSL